MKKLLHIVLYLPYGGLEKIVYDLSVALNGKEYEVHVVALQEGGPMQELLEKADIPVHVLRKRPGKFDFSLLINLTKLIKKLHIDVIHSHSGCIMYAALAGRLAGVSRIIHTEHGRYFPDPLTRILEDYFSSIFISKYICVSRELENYISKTVKVPKNKITTIINGIDTSTYFKYPETLKQKLRSENNIPVSIYVIGTVCRLIRAKNLNFLIEWFQKYGIHHDKLMLLIVGDGPQYEEWYKLSSQIDNNRIKFFGSRKDIPDLLNIFDIFTLVSTTEGTSITVLEAMASELPVIVSDVGGNSDIVKHNQTGYLFKCNDTNQFNIIIEKILTNRNEMKKIGESARASIEQNYNINNFVKKYESVYKK